MAASTRRPSLLRSEHLDLATDAGSVAVLVRRDRRARNYTLRVKDASGTPVLTMPVYGSLNEARAFLDRHAGWLARQIEKAPPPRPIADGATIPLRGIPHLIRHAPGKRGTVGVGDEEGTPTLVVAGAAEHLRRRVLDYLRREARCDIEPAALGYAARLGVRPKAIRVRDTFTRWGSCSAAGELSFSFRLVMAPPFVLDYLAAHEVAHLREMNHSRRFWRLVEGLCPECDRARRWLMREGPGLHAIGVERRLI
jgi:predicted metal-dependent hydrolase